MNKPLWRFSDDQGSFASERSNSIKSLYFPLANDTLMSCVSPDLHGDSKTSHNSFLLTPVSRIDLSDSRSSRNFWIYNDKFGVWSLTGVSKQLSDIQSDSFSQNAGLLWHTITRANLKIGLEANILSFVPAADMGVEIMQVTLRNISSKTISFVPTSAIPLYAKSANNIRDHRHVTSLLNRVWLHTFGVVVTPTLLFDEAGHHPNQTTYFCVGWDNQNKAAVDIFPTQEMFTGDSGDLEAPEAVLRNLKPSREDIQGREAFGGLRFKSVKLKPKQTLTYTIVFGVVSHRREIDAIIKQLQKKDAVIDLLSQTKKHWYDLSAKISINSDDLNFNNWFRWVGIQPTLRKIFGCSFLPDFDYGKGGRGWRDLWQDCLGLILRQPESVREMLVNNFAGVRIDGSNATIIGKKPGEFISDRNNISRVWMDHGIWPLITLDLYLHETGDFSILFEKTGYFCDHHVWRSRLLNPLWRSEHGFKLYTVQDKEYKGSIFEHMLIQNLTQFFNVGEHNHIRLEGADWNDGLDMAKDKGESVAFSALYAQNLETLARIIRKSGVLHVSIAEEIKILFTPVDYTDPEAKNSLLDRYFKRTAGKVSGKYAQVKADVLAQNLESKSRWLMQHIRQSEWLKAGFFNGYYDNKSKRVEGISGKNIRMMLASQVFPIMSGVATVEQTQSAYTMVRKFLYDEKLGGYRLNSDFKQEEHSLGRAFSFVYGDKENGAFFSHMNVMFAYALYKQGKVKEAWHVVHSLYAMSLATEKSKIYPCLPEYFDITGRGMYSYLTGSASWFVLTLLTQSLGIKGENGDLVCEPKLCKEQFGNSTFIALKRSFAGRSLLIRFHNPERLDWGEYQIRSITCDESDVPEIEINGIKAVIKRKFILSLSKNRVHTVNILFSR